MPIPIRFTGLVTILCALFLISGVSADQTPAAKPAVAQPAAPGPPPKAASDTRLTSIGGFTVDYPTKDWPMLGGVGSALVVFFHKSREAAIAIERIKLVVPMAMNDIVEETATNEINDWKDRRPLAYGFSHQFADEGAARTIVIDFNQPGPLGIEHVRLYTLLRGLDRYRVTCTTLETNFKKYIDTCHRVARSLYPTTTNQ